MEKNCLVCGSILNLYLYNETLMKCSSCGFITANLSVDEDALRKIYSVNYFHGGEYADYQSDKAILVENFKRKITRIVKQVSPHSIKHVLEIGCAYGFFGEELLRQFPDATYTGFDVAEDACRYAMEKLHLDARCEDFLDSSLAAHFTDVFMWDVIEHLTQPDLYLGKICRLMESRGRIYITTGDIGAFIPKVMKANWRLIHPPSHLNYFTKDSLMHLLKKNGFTVKDISYPSTTRSIKQVFHSFFLMQKKEDAFYRDIYDHIPERWSININTRDIMFVIAEKGQ